MERLVTGFYPITSTYMCHGNWYLRTLYSNIWEKIIAQYVLY